jgi:hypothetical protein
VSQNLFSQSTEVLLRLSPQTQHKTHTKILSIYATTTIVVKQNEIPFVIDVVLIIFAMSSGLKW